MITKNKHHIYPEFECEYTAELVCPYCGEEQSDSWEVSSTDEECGSATCQHCNEEFDYSVNKSVDYSTTCSDGKHEYVRDNYHIDDCWICKRCGDMQFERHNKKLPVYK